MKDGVDLGHSEPVLRINSVTKADRGMYQCFVRNDAESAQATGELKLGGRCANSAGVVMHEFLHAIGTITTYYPGHRMFVLKSSIIRKNISSPWKFHF